MDSHSTHYCPETIHLARKEEVILFMPLPNTTHLSQPLDKGCFDPLKARWCQICHEYCVQNPGKCVTRFCFSELFSRTWIAIFMFRFSHQGVTSQIQHPHTPHHCVTLKSSICILNELIGILVYLVMVTVMVSMQNFVRCTCQLVALECSSAPIMTACYAHAS